MEWISQEMDKATCNKGNDYERRLDIVNDQRERERETKKREEIRDINPTYHIETQAWTIHWKMTYIPVH